MDSKEIAQLKTDVAELMTRVTLLETNTNTQVSHQVQDVAPGEIDFQLMQRLQNRKGEQFEAGGVAGSIVYAGDFRNEVTSQARHMERPVPFLATHEPEHLAALFAALGNPQRLSIVQQLLHGPRDRQQLQDFLGNPSPGQLYHHLHNLMDAGVIIQQRRGVYAIAPNTAVSILVLIAASIDITIHQSNIEEID